MYEVSRMEYTHESIKKDVLALQISKKFNADEIDYIVNSIFNVMLFTNGTYDYDKAKIKAIQSIMFMRGGC
jgi:hypothetical protein